MKEVNSEILSIFRAFYKYGYKGFSYTYWRYYVAPKILKLQYSLENQKTRDDFTIHMMMGKRDFLMGCWSLASLHRVMPEMGQVFVHSDGSLGEHEQYILRTLFPSIRIEDVTRFLDLHGSLINAYPVLKKFRETYPKFQIRIVDQHFLSEKKFRLFVDSDLLWFKEPTEIVRSLTEGVPVPLMMSNAEYIRMEFADGSITDDTTSRPNGGIVLYRDFQMNLERMQEFLKKSDYITKRFGDQAWMAWTLEPKLLPESTYIIKGTLTESIVVRHYTNPQRLKFYFYGLNFIADAILHRHVRD